MAREYTKRTVFGIIKVFIDGNIVTSFSAGPDGAHAYQMFLQGTARNTKDTVFDEDAQQYVVGDLGQMVG